MDDAKKQYADIIDLPHHTSKTRPRMDRIKRAAQFSPFAALTGYGDLVAESARYTAERVELDDDERQILARQLTFLLAHPEQKASFTVFVPDARKAGGAYETVTDRVKKYDPLERRVTLSGGRVFPLDDLIAIDDAADAGEQTVF